MSRIQKYSSFPALYRIERVSERAKNDGSILFEMTDCFFNIFQCNVIVLVCYQNMQNAQIIQSHLDWFEYKLLATAVYGISIFHPKYAQTMEK